MANRWGNHGNSERLYFLGLQNHCKWWLQPWNLKMLAPWKKSYDQSRQHMEKQRPYFTDKGPSSQSYGFSSGHVWMWNLDYKEGWAPKNWCFWKVMLEKTLESPLNCKEIQPVHSAGTKPWDFFGKVKVKVKSLSGVWLFATSWIVACQSPLPLLSSRVCLNSCPLNWRCYPTISFPVIPFSSWLQSFPASGSFPVSWLFASCGQDIGASASASILPMSIQDWFPLGLTGLISLLSKGFSRVFFSTTVLKHQFFSSQPSLCSICHICTWLLEKP